MRVFQTTYKDKDGIRHRLNVWWLEFRDHQEIRRRLPGLKDRRQTEAVGRNVERLVWCRVAGEPLDPVLTKWVEGLPPKIMRALSRFGLLSAAKVAALRPLLEHLEGAADTPGFKQHLQAKANTSQHVRLTIDRARSIIEGCGFKVWSDVSASQVMAFLHGLQAPRKNKRGEPRPGIGDSSFNHYLTAFKAFCAWMLRDGRAAQNPVAYLQRRDAHVNPRVERRALEVDEVRRLLAATEAGPMRYGMSGHERATIYRLALETGLRRSELASLTRASFDFSGPQPTVTLEAASSKHRRRDLLPLRRDTAEVLKRFLATKFGTAPVFYMPRWRNMAKMLRKDLQAARIPDKDGDGRRIVDFHALRHTAASLLAATGVHPKVAQSLMRHSDINLTMSRYSHVLIGQESDAVEALPDLSAPPRKEVRATGTDGSTLARNTATQNSAQNSTSRCVLPRTNTNQNELNGPAEAKPDETTEPQKVA